MAAADQVAALRKAAAANPGLLLAPLTRGGTVPFRRLCYDFGARITLSEMVYSRQLLKGDRLEQARLRRAPEVERKGGGKEDWIQYVGV